MTGLLSVHIFMDKEKQTLETVIVLHRPARNTLYQRTVEIRPPATGGMKRYEKER